MSNENLLSSQTLADYYREYAAKNGLSTTTFAINTKDCVILAPYVNQEKAAKAKEDLANSLYPHCRFKAAVVNVPLLIVFEMEDILQCVVMLRQPFSLVRQHKIELVQNESRL